MRKRFKSGHVTSLRSDSVCLFQEKKLLVSWKPHTPTIDSRHGWRSLLTLFTAGVADWFVKTGLNSMTKVISDLKEFPSTNAKIESMDRKKDLNRVS